MSFLSLVRYASSAHFAARKVYVIGVGMTKFEKPGRRISFDYPDMAHEAATQALDDARIKFDAVQQAVCGYVYGESTCGQRAVYGLGMTGIPVYNVNNNCATGSTAINLARQMIEGGASDCVLAMGFEKMQSGSLGGPRYTDRAFPTGAHVARVKQLEPAEVNSDPPPPRAPLIFGAAGKEYMEKYGVKPERMAMVAEKNHAHSAANPYSQFQQTYTLREILDSPKVAFSLTKLQCCPTSDGAAAAVLASEEFVRAHALEDRAVHIVGMQMATDLDRTFDTGSPMEVAGFNMTRHAVDKLYKQTGLSPSDFQVVELHDCFSANELITYDGLRLCPPGKAADLIEASWRGRAGAGQTIVINPAGGLISKGHPLGATGLAQCAELNWQLRGEAGARQQKGVRYALQHNLGLGGAVVVAAYTLGWPEKVPRSCETGHALSLGQATRPVHEQKLAERLSRAKYEEKEKKKGKGKSPKAN